MSISTDPNKIEELLSRGVEAVYPKRDFLKSLLMSGKQLTLYTGYDPTAPTLHIGHGISMLKLRQFQELGHKIIMLVGDFTAMIGDPTDKSAARTRLTPQQVKENYKLYKRQASTILDFSGRNKAEVRFNSKWLSKLSFAEVVELSSHFTVQQMLERDMFERRMSFKMRCNICNFDWEIQATILPGQGVRSKDSGKDLNNQYICPNCKTDHNSQEAAEKSVVMGRPTFTLTNPSPVFLHEFFYPLMQGYDSVAMGVDGEVGGNDQIFNMLAGRDLMKELKKKEKFVLAIRLLTDANGKKMSKTEGNMIAFSDSPEDVFGKVMRWTDEMILNGFELCTRVPMDEVRVMSGAMKSGANPRDFKLRLAYEVTKTFLGEAAAKRGQENFATVIQSKDRPVDIPELAPSASDILSVLVEAGFVKSRGEGRRDIDGGGVRINDEKVTSVEATVKAGDIVQKGKRFFVKIV